MLLLRQTYGYFPSCRASQPFDQYQIILFGEQRHNLSWVVTWQCLIRESNQQPCNH